MQINVTQSFLPPISEYNVYVNNVFKSRILTNGGPLEKSLQEKLSNYLGVKHFSYVTNGTIALQIAIKAIGIEYGEIITTPFSYVATLSSILWEKCKPVFVDIEPNNYTINAEQIEAAINKNTRAILPVHVFGYACDVEKIQHIANKHNIKVIYDGAHAFASKYKGKSLLEYGDISTLSFHATKLFHTVEGGACITHSKELINKIELIKRFGHNKDDYYMLGINAKQSELHAAMGLANYPYIDYIIKDRKRISNYYDFLLDGFLERPKRQKYLEYNYAYFPVLFETEKLLKKTISALNKQDIYPRRYFWPSLNNLPYLNPTVYPISENISSRIVCLPLYVGLEDSNIEKIVKIIKGV